jgi:hypothetical protein
VKHARKPLTMALIGFGLGATMALGVAAPANAVDWGALNPKRFMVNVLGRVMAAAGDTDWKRAIIAGEQTYNHSFEGFEQQWLAKVPAGTPGTHADYVLAAQETYAKNNLTATPGDVAHPNSKKYAPKQKMPSTKVAKVVKNIRPVAGGVAAVGAYMGWEQRASIADGVMSFMGMSSSADAVCSSDQANNWLVTTIAGADCKQWQLDKAYDPNQDVLVGTISEGLCTVGPERTPLIGTKNVVPNCRAAVVRASPGTNTYVDAGYAVINSVTKTTSTNFVVSITQSPRNPTLWSQMTATVNLSFGCLDAAGTIVDTGGNDFIDEAVAGKTYTMNVPTCGGGYRRVLFLTNVTGQTLSTGKTGTVYVEGSPLTPFTTQKADPSRVITCTVTGTDGKTYSKDSPAYVDSKGETSPAECAPLPDGVFPANTRLDEKVDGKLGDAPLLNQPSTPEYLGFVGAYPECQDGMCKLDLKTKPDKTVSCFDNAATWTACAEWFKDPAKTDHYQCTYGVHEVSIEECYIYADVFKPDKLASGHGYVDPQTGLPVTQPTTPAAGRDAMVRPAVDPQDAAGCMGAGWAEANPIEWVLVPIQCALQWAFVPSPMYAEAAAIPMLTSFEDRAPGQIAAVASSWKFDAQFTGCRRVANYDPGAVFAGTGNGQTLLWDACPGGPQETLGLISRAVVTLAFLTMVILVVKRRVGQTVDYS